MRALRPGDSRQSTWVGPTARRGIVAAVAAIPIYGLEDFLDLLESGDYYPYYSVILYTPQNGLDQRLHEYVDKQWRYLNQLTGSNSLLAALENRERDRAIGDFKPEDVYDIARELGVSVAAVPALVFFASPKERADTLVVRLGDFLPADVSDADLTDFFRSLAAIVDECAARDVGDHLECLRRGIAEEWPADSVWADRANEIGNAVVSSTTQAATVVGALATIMKFFGL
jgi:hypothetical protein